MDLNVQPPATWTISGPYEVADYCIAKRTNVLVLLNAWLDSASSEDRVVDLDTMSYWAERLRPLWEEKEEAEEGDDNNDNDEESVISEDKETIVIVCNRCGSENGQSIILFLFFERHCKDVGTRQGKRMDIGLILYFFCFWI